MYGAQHAGYIRYQIGNVLLAQTEAIKLGQVETHADLSLHLITICFPKLARTMEEAEMEAAKLEAMFADEIDAYSSGKQKEQDRLRPALFNAVQRMNRRLLWKMSEEKLYAYMETGIKDGSDLSLKDADEAEEAPVRA